MKWIMILKWRIIGEEDKTKECSKEGEEEGTERTEELVVSSRRFQHSKGKVSQTPTFNGRRKLSLCSITTTIPYARR